MALIAPSVFAADFARLGEALQMIKAAGAKMVHVDVRDGHFAPGITAGQPVIRSLRKATDLVLEVHLLVERPERYAKEFVELGADRVALHAEATPQLHGALAEVRAAGATAGVALNPATSLEAISEALEIADFVLLLSADAGLEERPLPSSSVARARRAAELRASRRLDFAIEVEGGVGPENLEELVRAGADILVAGSSIFRKSGDPRPRLEELIRRAATARASSTV
jgi:ribulose-phosphate 3-epimerase